MLANATQNVPVRQITLRERVEYVALRLVAGAVRRAAAGVGAGGGGGDWRDCLEAAGAAAARGDAEPGDGVSGEDSEVSARRFCAGCIDRWDGSWRSSARCRSIRRRGEPKFIRYEGLENYLAARAKGKGVLVLTGHLGAWELSSFYHSLMGYADVDGDSAAG